MCGIAGVVGGRRDLEEPAVERMVGAIVHRGPDDRGLWAEDSAVLGNCRLQVIDLAAGHQPLSGADGSMWITYNGEVYNYRELRAELLDRGHTFRTHTDTEVVLHMYEEFGPAALERLRGMFAFAIWDARRKRLFAARDRFGQKPLFYAELDGRLAFCSEIKGILAHPDVSVAPELRAVDHYLAMRYVPPPLTLFEGIHKLPPASWLTWENGRSATGTWWEPAFATGARRTEQEWIEGLRERLDAAVRAHLTSDVEVGAFLSGGLDSSIVVASMARQTDEPVKTFAVGSHEPSFDERPHARRVAEYCRTEHSEHVVDEALLEGIPGLVRCLDEPSDPIAACFYESARLAAGSVKVVLGGDGGDEMFAGFDRYAVFDTLDRIRLLPGPFRNGVLGRLLRHAPLGFGYKAMTQKLRWALEMADRRGGDRYARMSNYFRFGVEARESIYGPGMQAASRAVNPEAEVAHLYETAPAEDALSRMIYTDLRTRFPEHTLMLSDRLAMAHGLELRSPLLDERLADYCFSMPSSLKIRRGETKYALRRAAEGRLPPEIIARKKQGFMFPVAQWLHADGGDRLVQRLSKGPLVREGWLHEEAAALLMAEHRARRSDHHVRIWMLLNLDAWMRIYMDGEPE